MSEICYRVLLPEEWPRIPLEAWDTTRERPVPEHTILYAAEADGQIIGCIGGQQVICVRPFWVMKEHRGSGVAQQLAMGGYDLLPNMHKVFVTQSRHAELMALNLGFDPLKGALWLKED